MSQPPRDTQVTNLTSSVVTNSLRTHVVRATTGVMGDVQTNDMAMDSLAAGSTAWDEYVTDAWDVQNLTTQAVTTATWRSAVMRSNIATMATLAATQSLAVQGRRWLLPAFFPLDVSAVNERSGSVTLGLNTLTYSTGFVSPVRVAWAVTLPAAGHYGLKVVALARGAANATLTLLVDGSTIATSPAISDTGEVVLDLASFTSHAPYNSVALQYNAGSADSVTIGVPLIYTLL